MASIKHWAALGLGLGLVTGLNAVWAVEKAETFESYRFARVRPVKMNEVVWTHGFWADQYHRCRDQMVPKMWDLMKGEQYKPFYRHFQIAAGDIEGRQRGAQWNDGDFYKWMEAACLVQAVEGKASWTTILDEVVDTISRAQRADGYLHTPVLIAARNGEKGLQPFQDRFNFEMYNFGHLFTAASVHYEVTGQSNFLSVAIKAADFLERAFQNPTKEMAMNSVCPSHYMGLIDLYRVTGEVRYLRLAQFFIGLRDQIEGGGDDNQDRIPFLEQREALGHAVRANYLYAGVTDLVLETGEKKWMVPLKSIWTNVVTRKLYITGGCGALYDGASPDGSSNQRVITRVHQSYGRDYQLPNLTAYNETCANIGNVLWNWRMFLATGEASFVDVLETSYLNSVLSGVDLEGENYFYVNPLRNLLPMPMELRWSRTRVPFVTSFCCPPNLVRSVARMGQYAYGVGGEGVWVNLYGSNRLKTQLASGDWVELVQESQFPWEGGVELKWERVVQGETDLNLRVPGWVRDRLGADSAEGVEVRINGQGHWFGVEKSGYLRVRRAWKVGDRVELTWEMKPVWMEANPLIEELSGHLALKRGPLVYCLESADLPERTSVLDVAVDAKEGLEWSFGCEEFKGIGLLTGNLWVKEGRDWDRQLYRTRETPDWNLRRTTWIPYYLWGNRGLGEMSVWVPER